MGGKCCGLYNGLRCFKFVLLLATHYMSLCLLLFFLSFLVCICAQWLGLDKELKKLVVETTANQVTFWCLSVVLMFVMFL